MNARAEAAARELLHEFGVVDAPVDPTALAKRVGADVVRTSMDHALSGMLVRDDEHLAIGVNRSHSAARQRFTVAHELGHLRMHRGRPLIVDSAVRVNFRDPASASASNREEIEANAFAAALLMPGDWVMTEAAGHDDEDPQAVTARLAKRFGVSEQAMTFRLINLGVLSSS